MTAVFWTAPDGRRVPLNRAARRWHEAVKRRAPKIRRRRGRKEESKEDRKIRREYAREWREERASKNAGFCRLRSGSAL